MTPPPLQSSDNNQRELRPLMKRIISTHFEKSPDYCLDTLFAAMINDGWKKIPNNDPLQSSEWLEGELIKAVKAAVWFWEPKERPYLPHNANSIVNEAKQSIQAALVEAQQKIVFDIDKRFGAKYSDLYDYLVKLNFDISHSRYVDSTRKQTEEK